MKPTHSNLGKAARTLGVALLALQSACTTQETNTPTAAVPLSAYDQAIELLADGKQPEAERIVEAACSTNWVNPDLWFLRGVLERSRFSKHDAATCLTIAWSLAPETDHALAAKTILLMDRNHTRWEEINSGFATLKRLIDKHPDDLLVRWLFAIQCREHRWAQCHRAEEGVRQYEIILREWDPGPVLIHQTYANILSEQLGRHEEALIHRKIAVEQSYKAWTCQGYGNTLRKLGRFDEATEWLEKAVELDPDSPAYQQSLNFAKTDVKSFAKATNTYEKIKFYRRKGDEQMALELCKQALKEGDIRAYAEMGIIYRVGRSGIQKSQIKAAEYFKKGYEAGDGRCATLLAITYRQGIAGPKNEELALKWFKLGAEKDQYKSIQRLIYYYAAHTDPSQCDVGKAWEYQQQLDRLRPDAIDTPSFAAMIHAREGNFDKAIKLQQEVIVQCNIHSSKSTVRRTIFRQEERLACYRKKTPWVENNYWTTCKTEIPTHSGNNIPQP